jgi:hypothetical protein
MKLRAVILDECLTRPHNSLGRANGCDYLNFCRTRLDGLLELCPSTLAFLYGFNTTMFQHIIHKLR